MLAAVSSSSPSGGGPQEGIDHLLLLPERVLSMDSTSLRQDLASLHFSLHLLQRAPAQGNVWLSGAAPVDPNQKQSSSRPSSAKQGGLHWFAHGAEAPALTNSVSGIDSEGSSDRYGRDTWSDGTSLLDEGKENAAVTQRDREERLRQLKERQNEERQRKLEELKQQALAAQKFREQKEEERRRRMEELRLRDNDRRHQVEERKRQIWEAERDRREAILRKNQEREARIESKRKNERSSIMFAFGSSTPRMLEPADTGGSYWATRSLVTGYDEGALKIDRKTATSTSNVMMLSMTAPPGPLTRRSSERELDGSKKRATSAGGINRNKTEGMRSGEVTPSRPQSALSQHSVTSSISGGMTTSVTSSNVRSRPVATPRRPRPYSIAVTGISSAPDTPRQSLSSEHRAGKSGASANEKPPLPKVHTTKKQPAPAKPELAKKPSEKIKSTKSSAATTPKATPLQSPGVEAPPLPASSDTPVVDVTTLNTATTLVANGGDVAAAVSGETVAATDQPPTPTEASSDKVVAVAAADAKPLPAAKVEQPTPEQQQPAATAAAQPQNVQPDTLHELPESDMTASMIARKITTEEEAKAALAERRRLAREQAEREAEMERQRLEAERLAEEERLRVEEEEQKRAEEEQLRLLEEARLAEEQRLQEAIKETQKREEEERRRKEEEEKLKKEKEEAERKAKEEAEKQRQEMEIRLKKEEEDRQARRKRVEAIMLRTRGKGTTPTSTPSKDGDELYDSPSDELKMSANNGVVEQFLAAERSQPTAVVLDQPPSPPLPAPAPVPSKHNGHRNGHDHNDEALEKNNITNNLLDLSSLETSQPTGEILQPSPGDTTTNGKLANEDSVNFNNQSFIAFQDSNSVNDLLS